ncbi:hypothetical protein [Chryseobacterium sp. GVT01B]|uniref:hypothetical protein n=1 Tax=Chryseobacterium sp. GVT01B TaxID=2862675 RepID=UPI001CBEE749|nr:hypothetical protein [Chryseobacterium sp. GVT01B]
MQKNCIIFDNEDQSEEIEKLERDAKLRYGITLTCEQFNVGSTEKTEFLTSGKIDISKVITEFKKKFSRGANFHIAAFDWDLGDDKIDGVELIRLLNADKIMLKTPKILYSGLLEDKISGQLDAFKKNQIKKDGLLKRIKALIKIDIKDFVERDGYEQEIISTILKEEDSLDFLIEKELEKFPEMIFKNRFVSDSFNGKSFKEVNVLICNNDRLRNEFKKEIIEQVIAYLTTSYS